MNVKKILLSLKLGNTMKKIDLVITFLASFFLAAVTVILLEIMLVYKFNEIWSLQNLVEILKFCSIVGFVSISIRYLINKF